MRIELRISSATLTATRLRTYAAIVRSAPSRAVGRRSARLARAFEAARAGGILPDSGDVLLRIDDVRLVRDRHLRHVLREERLHLVEERLALLRVDRRLRLLQERVVLRVV